MPYSLIYLYVHSPSDSHALGAQVTLSQLMLMTIVIVIVCVVSTSAVILGIKQHLFDSVGEFMHQTM